MGGIDGKTKRGSGIRVKGKGEEEENCDVERLDVLLTGTSEECE